MFVRMGKLKVSVVINTYNRSKSLRKTLDSFRWQTYSEFEIVVVNGPSTDNTFQLLEEYSNKIKIISCAVANISVSRNIGISHSVGDIVAFIDDDAVPYPNWLQSLCSQYDENDVGGVGGFVWNHTGIEYQTRYIICDRYGENRKLLHFDPSDFYSFPGAAWYPSLIGVNASFRKNVLLEIGGFNETYAYYLDETDVCLRIIDSGYKILFAPSAKVHHKYLPSHIRDESRRTINVQPFVKSKAYFVLTHGVKFHGQICAESHIQEWLKDRREDVELGFMNKDYSDEGRVRALAEIEDGYVEALARIGGNTNEHLTRLDDNFKHFPAAHKGRRIVIISGDYPPDANGGIGIWMNSVATGLAGLGNEVHVIARATICESVEFESGTWLHRISTLLAHGQPTLNHKELDIPVNVKDWGYSAFNRIEFIAADFGKIDFVISPIWELEGCYTYDSKKFQSIIFLQTTFGLSLESHPEWKQEAPYFKEFVSKIIAVEDRLLKNGPFLLANSHGLLDALEKKYRTKIEPNRTKVVHIGVKDLLGDQCTNKFNNNEVRGLFVGRLEVRKGIDLIFDILPAAFEQVPELVFDIVGDTSIPVYGTTTILEKYRSSLESYIEKGRLRIHGKVDQNRLIEFYNSCDLFVAPSRFESFGIIFVEAMSCAKPVVACNVGGVTEVVGDAGLLIDVDDTNGLLDCVIRLAKDYSFRTELGQLARKRYENNFYEILMSEKIMQLMEELINENKD